MRQSALATAGLVAQPNLLPGATCRWVCSCLVPPRVLVQGLYRDAVVAQEEGEASLLGAAGLFIRCLVASRSLFWGFLVSGYQASCGRPAALLTSAGRLGGRADLGARFPTSLEVEG